MNPKPSDAKANDTKQPSEPNGLRISAAGSVANGKEVTCVDAAAGTVTFLLHDFLSKYELKRLATELFGRA